nr:hypothetical protein [uncultured Caproiciproducens sp.]
MAAKKPFTFTSVSYIVDKTGDGSVRCREEIVFEQIPSPKGTYQFKSIKRTIFMPEEEQIEYDKRMMKHAGEVMSEYLACHLD